MQPSHSAKSMEDTLSKKTSTSSPPPRRDVTPSPKRAKLELAEPDMEVVCSSLQGDQTGMAMPISQAFCNFCQCPTKFCQCLDHIVDNEASPKHGVAAGSGVCTPKDGVLADKPSTDIVVDVGASPKHGAATGSGVCIPNDGVAADSPSADKGIKPPSASPIANNGQRDEFCTGCGFVKLACTCLFGGPKFQPLSIIMQQKEQRPKQIDNEAKRAAQPTGLSMEGPTSSAQQPTMARESSTAHKETFKVPPKGPKPPVSVKEFYESYVLPKLDGPGPLFVEPFLHVWVPHRYCEVTCHKECPNIQELRDYMRYVQTGHKSLSLWLTVEYRASVGYRVMLKSASNNQQQQLGSYVFRGMRDGKISKAAFLWVDMLQLIMLLAKRIEADPLIVKSWFEEAKLYLTTSNIGLELS